ncbi:MAG: TrkH family potassium uptake protein [Kiloniellaceae bacterium]
MTPVARVGGLLLCGRAGVMLIPAAVDAAFDNADWTAFVESAAVTGFIGGAMVLATAHAGPFELNLRQAFLLTVACWLAVTAFAALPFLGLGLDYTDAFFEASSGITTTGSTVISGLDHSPPGILLWRSLLQWVGGLGIIVMAIVILPFLRVGGMQLFHTESSERSEKVVPSAFHLSAWIVAIYVTLTGLCAVLYGIGEMSAFDAVNHAMATLSTGGYSTHDASFAYFQDPATQWTGTVFMLAGALPFVAYIRFAKGERRAFWRDSQIRSLLRFLALSALAMAGWLWLTQDIAFVDALRLTAFNITSVVTTTGFASDDYGAWGALAVGAFLVFTFIGGCTGSTSGAIKIFRHQVIWIVLRGQLMRLISPRRVVILRYSGRTLPPDVPVSVLAFVAVFMATVGFFTIALAGMGLDLQTALSASATAITNVGPGLGPVVGPATNFASLPDAAKWLLSIAMLLGRLEIFSVLVLFDPEFWRS